MHLRTDGRADFCLYSFLAAIAAAVAACFKPSAFRLSARAFAYLRAAALPREIGKRAGLRSPVYVSGIRSMPGDNGVTSSNKPRIHQTRKLNIVGMIHFSSAMKADETTLFLGGRKRKRTRSTLFR